LIIIPQIKPATFDAYISVVDTTPATWEYLHDTGYDVQVQPLTFYLNSWGAGLFLGVDTWYHGIQTGTTLPDYHPNNTGGIAIKFQYATPTTTKFRFRIYVWDWWNNVQINCKDWTMDLPPSVIGAGRSETVYSTNDNFGWWSDSTHPLSWLNVGHIIDDFVIPQPDDYRLWRIVQQGNEIIYRSEYASDTLGMIYGYNVGAFTLPGTQPHWRPEDKFQVRMEISYQIYDGGWTWYVLKDVVIGGLWGT
jgi:hypothetical protein